MNVTLQRKQCAVLLIDYQELLFNAMPEDLRERNLHQATVLLRSARILGLSLVVTEQYPRGLGPTLGPLRGAYEEMRPYPKLEFSAADVDGVVRDLKAASITDILIAGMETHICVLQSTIALQAMGFQCHIMADAVMSRRSLNWRQGLALCERAGAIVSNVETALFQVLGSADADGFKAVSRMIR